MREIQFVGVEPETLIQAITENVTERVLAGLSEVLKPDPADRFLTVTEAAAFLNLKPSTIYNKIRSRELPHIKRGNRLHFSEAALREYLNGGRQMTKEEEEKQ